MKKTALLKAELKAWTSKPALTPTDDDIEICECGKVKMWTNGVRDMAYCKICGKCVNKSVGSQWIK